MNTSHKKAQNITLIGSAANILLAVTKIAAGLFGRSEALVADGIHSFSDLVSDAVVIVGIKVSGRPADISHPLGHGKYEALSTILTSLILALAGMIIAYHAIFLVSGGSRRMPPAPITLIVVLVSIVSKEWLFRATKSIGQELNSGSLIANAWHHRSDAASSLVVLVGIVASYFGIWFADSAAAVIVGVLIIYEAYAIAKDAVSELVDAQMISESQLNKIKSEISNIAGVFSVNSIITRKYGPNYIVDLSVAVGSISMELSTKLSAEITKLIKNNLSNVKQVNVYFEASCDISEINDSKQERLSKRLIEISKNFDQIMGLHNYSFINSKRGVIAAIDIEVPGNITTEQSHKIGKLFKDKAMIDSKDIIDMVVHVDPYHPDRELQDILWRKNG